MVKNHSKKEASDKKTPLDANLPSRKLLTTNEIKNKLKKHQSLISIAKQYLDVLVDFVEDNSIIALLTDEEGCIIHLKTNPKLSKQLLKSFIMPGAFPAPDSILAQAFSKAFQENRVVQIDGDIFFSEFNAKHWSCWLSPIQLGSVTLVGTLSVCVPKSLKTSCYGSLLKLSVMSLEQELNFRDEKQQVLTLKEQQLNLFNSHTQADLILDKDGVIKLISNKACDLFGIDRNSIEHTHIAKYVSDWHNLPIRKIKEGGIESEEVEVSNVPNAGLYLLSTRAIMVSSVKYNEIICSLRSIKQVIAETNKYSRNWALYTFDDIIAESPAMKRIVKEAKKTSVENSHVIIFGEEDSGKETLAQAIHNRSGLASGGFVKVDLSVLNPKEMEEMLWGYTEKYKPYIKKLPRLGALEFANGGTLYINDIGLLPLPLQVKLLKVLKQGKLTRLGAQASVGVDARIICSSTYDLSKKIEQGDFNLDLYYTLSNESFRLPPLRERRADIASVIDHFIKIKSLETKKKAPNIPKKIMLLLRRYEWPHNFKEIKKFAEIVVIDQGKMFESFRNERQFKQEHLYLDKQIEIDSILPLEESEKQLILKAYNAYNGSISKTARRLGISRNTLYLKLKRYSID